jgi:hypothetical protein
VAITEVLLEKYYGQPISVICGNGNVVRGLFDGHTSELDNEPDGESILVKTDDGRLIEVYTSDIAEITGAETKHTDKYLEKKALSAS